MVAPLCSRTSFSYPPRLNLIPKNKSCGYRQLPRRNRSRHLCRTYHADHRLSFLNHWNNFGQFQFGYLPAILPLPSTHLCPQRFNSTSSNSVSPKFLKIKSSSVTAFGTISQVPCLNTGSSLSKLFISSPWHSTSRGQHQRCRPLRSVP